MNLSQLVTSREVSQELWDKGVRIPSCFGREVKGGRVWVAPKTGQFGFYTISCYTFQQIWEILPKTIEGEQTWEAADLELDCYSELMYETVEGSAKMSIAEDTLPDTAAKALIWALDEGYITLEEVNHESE